MDLLVKYEDKKDNESMMWFVQELAEVLVYHNDVGMYNVLREMLLFIDTMPLHLFKVIVSVLENLTDNNPELVEHDNYSAFGFPLIYGLINDCKTANGKKNFIYALVHLYPYVNNRFGSMSWVDVFEAKMSEGIYILGTDKTYHELYLKIIEIYHNNEEFNTRELENTVRRFLDDIDFDQVIDHMADMEIT